MGKCVVCNSNYHSAKGEEISAQVVILNCIAANLADLVVAIEEK